MPPDTAPRLERTLPADADHAAAGRRELAAFVAAHGGSPALRTAVELAVAEALNNVAMHAYREGAAGAAHLVARIEDDELVVTVADDGVGMVPREDSPGCGYGIGLMTKLADVICVSDRDPGTEVRLHFAWATA